MVLGYPLAYLIAKTRNVAGNTLLMILVLAAMQLDMVIRLYGMMVLLGDRGLINGALVDSGLIESPLPLMYNTLGVIIGMVQFTLPFMVLSLIGVIRSIDPSLEEAARSIGATRRQAFLRIVLPLSMPGMLAGSLIVFALSISSFVVPATHGRMACDRSANPHLSAGRRNRELAAWRDAGGGPPSPESFRDRLFSRSPRNL